MFAKKVGREYRIPFEISADPFYSERNLRYLESVMQDVKAAEPPTAAQQRVVGAEANRIAALNAASPRAGISIPEGKRSFEIEIANLKPFSWGIERGYSLSQKRIAPFDSCRAR